MVGISVTACGFETISMLPVAGDVEESVFPNTYFVALLLWYCNDGENTTVLL